MERGKTDNFVSGSKFEYDYELRLKNKKTILCLSCNRHKAKRQFYGTKEQKCLRCRKKEQL